MPKPSQDCATSFAPYIKRDQHDPSGRPKYRRGHKKTWFDTKQHLCQKNTGAEPQGHFLPALRRIDESQQIKVKSSRTGYFVSRAGEIAATLSLLTAKLCPADALAEAGADKLPSPVLAGYGFTGCLDNVSGMDDSIKNKPPPGGGGLTSGFEPCRCRPINQGLSACCCETCPGGLCQSAVKTLSPNSPTLAKPTLSARPP